MCMPGYYSAEYVKTCVGSSGPQLAAVANRLAALVLVGTRGLATGPCLTVSLVKPLCPTS